MLLTHLFQHFLSQMKAVAGMKMSYSLQQAINLSRRTIIRGFRQDETHSALCSHLFTMIRGNRQHRRAFLISLLNLFDDSAVSKPAFIISQIFFRRLLWIKTTHFKAAFRHALEPWTCLNITRVSCMWECNCPSQMAQWLSWLYPVSPTSRKLLCDLRCAKSCAPTPSRNQSFFTY